MSLTPPQANGTAPSMGCAVLQLSCPMDKKPGDVITIMTMMGNMAVQIPAGTFPGSTFSVALPVFQPTVAAAAIAAAPLPMPSPSTRPGMPSAPMLPKEVSLPPAPPAPSVRAEATMERDALKADPAAEAKSSLTSGTPDAFEIGVATPVSAPQEDVQKV